MVPLLARSGSQGASAAAGASANGAPPAGSQTPAAPGQGRGGGRQDWRHLASDLPCPRPGKAARSHVLYLPHAVKQMARPDRLISPGEVERVVFEGDLIEDYPEDPRGTVACSWGRQREDLFTSSARPEPNIWLSARPALEAPDRANEGTGNRRLSRSWPRSAEPGQGQRRPLVLGPGLGLQPLQDYLGCRRRTPCAPRCRTLT